MGYWARETLLHNIMVSSKIVWYVFERIFTNDLIQDTGV
jgi:hypothetical protein